jgi:ribosomal subunit interface protein
VSERTRRIAREKLAALELVVKGPILGARVVLTQERNPRIATPARAEAETNLQGKLVRARTAALSLDAAVDDVAERLQRQLRRYVDRLITRQREPARWSPRVRSPATTDVRAPGGGSRDRPA